MRSILIVLRKELLDGRRDKRAVMSAMLFPILGPALVYFMLTFIVSMRSDSEQVVIPVVGADNAPAMIQWLVEEGVRIEDFEGDPRQAIRDKRHELIVVIPDNFEARIASGKFASIELVKDGSRTDAQPTIRRVEAMINRYGYSIAQLRLVARGVSPELGRPILVQDIDVASKQQRAAAALNFIPMYILLAAFVSGMGLAIDATAGERERKSLEPLLINPVERFHIVTGKWLAASTFASIGMILTATLCIVAMLNVDLDEVGLSFHITWLQWVAIILGTFPMAFLATSMQLFLGMFARSFKDAQSYMGLLVMFPMVPMFITMFNPLKTQDWMFAVPMLGQQLLLVELFGGKEIPAVAYVYSATTCLVLGFGLVLATARMFQRESVITS